MEHNIYFAYTYQSGAYGRGDYETGASATTSSGSKASSGSVLTNTGFDIALIVTIACVIALIAVLVRFWRRPSVKS